MTSHGTERKACRPDPARTRRSIRRSASTAAAVLFVAAAFAACVSLREIRGTAPVRTMDYAGSQNDLVRCIAAKVPGKIYRDPSGGRISIYDSVKRSRIESVTHFAVTVTATSPDHGTVTWQKLPHGPAPDPVVNRFWGPVETCVRQLRTPA